MLLWFLPCLLRRALRASASAVGCTVIGLAAFGGAASAAGEPDIYLPLYGGAHPSSGASGADRDQPASAAGASRRAEAVSSTLLAPPQTRFSLIELPPESVRPGGGYRRPHHAIGYRWLGAESWLREHGFEAQTCYLPMVRLHTRINASANVSGTLWIYGRCSFR